MFNIEKYLQKFSKNITSVEIYKEKIIEIINKYTQINISKNDIEIKNNIVYTKSSPAIKNKIFIFKEKILHDLENKISIKIIDIR